MGSVVISRAPPRWLADLACHVDDFSKMLASCERSDKNIETTCKNDKRKNVIGKVTNGKYLNTSSFIGSVPLPPAVLSVKDDYVFYGRHLCACCRPWTKINSGGDFLSLDN